MEKILCVNRKELPETWVKNESIVKLEEKDFIKKCSSLNFEFKGREYAEDNPDFKQIIPYIILQTIDGKFIAAYKRKGSEKRLHDLWSIGIGGHINPIDKTADNKPLIEIIQAGMERELTEELSKRNIKEKPAFIGIINEENTNVGSVHTGAVFSIFTNNKGEYAGGRELIDFQWLETGKVHDLNLELWSKLALKLISR